MSMRYKVALAISVISAVSALNAALAQSRTTTTKKPATTTAPSPKITPTASEGTTAIAARGRPVSTPAGRAVNGALKTALANANVRNAVRSEVLRQLRVRRPLAMVNGHWVSMVDLAPAYQAAGVRPALLAALGTNGPQLVDQARVSADRLTLVFTPATFGQIVLPEFASDITATLGVEAFTNHMTGIGPVVVIIVVAASGLGLLAMAADLAWNIWERAAMAYNDYTTSTGPTKDFDGDGIANKDDKDDDNDGTPDEDDNYPYDPTRTICDCGRPALSFLTTNAGDVLPSFVSALNATQAQRAKAVSLGAIAQSQSGSLALVF
jgi:hypothetical protein